MLSGLCEDVVQRCSAVPLFHGILIANFPKTEQRRKDDDQRGNHLERQEGEVTSGRRQHHEK